MLGKVRSLSSKVTSVAIPGYSDGRVCGPATEDTEVWRGLLGRPLAEEVEEER